jgi:hypothetical protein
MLMLTHPVRPFDAVPFGGDLCRKDVALAFTPLQKSGGIRFASPRNLC